MLEYCDLSLGEYLMLLSKKKKFDDDMFVNKLDRIIFQLIFTLCMIRKKYPTFQHNDFFIRNILGYKEKRYSKDDYIEYKYKGKSFYFSANGFMTKINDFGLSSVKNIYNPHISKHVKYNKSDLFCLLYDIYNGENLGSISLTNLFYNNKKKMRMLKTYFNKFFNVKKLNRMININKHIIDWSWNIENIKSLSSLVKTPEKYLKSNIFYNYSILPQGGNIVATYS